MKEKHILNLSLVVFNSILEHSRNDPISKAKIDRGEPLTMDDMERINAVRSEAANNLDQAIEDAIL